MIKRFFLVSVLCLFSALFKPCFAGNEDCAAAEAAVEDGTMDPDDFEDMYPFCGGDNIDMPLDDGVPFLLIAAGLFGVLKIYKGQNGLKEVEKISK